MFLDSSPSHVALVLPSLKVRIILWIGVLLK